MPKREDISELKENLNRLAVDKLASASRVSLLSQFSPSPNPLPRAAWLHLEKITLELEGQKHFPALLSSLAASPYLTKKNAIYIWLKFGELSGKHSHVGLSTLIENPAVDVYNWLRPRSKKNWRHATAVLKSDKWSQTSWAIHIFDSLDSHRRFYHFSAKTFAMFLSSVALNKSEEITSCWIEEVPETFLSALDRSPAFRRVAANKLLPVMLSSENHEVRKRALLLSPLRETKGRALGR